MTIKYYYIHEDVKCSYIELEYLFLAIVFIPH